MDPNKPIDKQHIDDIEINDNEEEVNLEKADSIESTSFKMYLKNIGLYELIEKFGQPHQEGSSDNKVRLCWGFRLDDETIFTIYDYKSDELTSKLKTWHVGGKGSSEKIKQYLSEMLGLEVE